MKKNLLLFLASFFISIFIAEIFLQLINSSKEESVHIRAEDRFMLFDEDNGEVFDVYDNFFKYKPNKEIFAETFYKIDEKYHKEYSYFFKTNNFGLVQDDDIEKSKKSILLLGASFIEGQGAPPWVNDLDLDKKNYQIINGGILGTGPQQMESLEKHISSSYKIDKLIFFYLGGEFRRDPFNIPINTIACLKDYTNCVGDENFYGFPLKSKNPKEFLTFLDNYRIKSLDNHIVGANKFKYYRRLIKRKISNLYVVKIPHNYLRNTFYKTKNEKILRNINSINNLIKKYNHEDLYIVQLNSVPQIAFGKSYESIFVENYLLEKNVKHYYCDFNNDIDNFHPNDGHPNINGYKSLRNCVQKIINLIPLKVN
jgi:hypothetical protein